MHVKVSSSLRRLTLRSINFRCNSCNSLNSFATGVSLIVIVIATLRRALTFQSLILRTTIGTRIMQDLHDSGYHNKSTISIRLYCIALHSCSNEEEWRIMHMTPTLEVSISNRQFQHSDARDNVRDHLYHAPIL